MLGWSALAFGQGSQRLSYSGRLASSAGVPVNGTVNLTIELYRNAASVCSQSIAGVVLANGVFNVELDFPANCTGALTWVQTLQAAHNAGDNMFIEVTDDTNSVTYPQQLLTSVPFAGVALNPNIPDGFVTTQMLGSMSASAGQVLQFNGASWGPVNVAGGGTVTSVAAGTGLDGGTITGAGTIGIANGGVDTAQLATDAVTTVKITDLNVTTAKLANTAVTSGKLADDAVTLAKIANGSAGGQVMKWDGSNWQLAADADSGGDITGVTAGAGLDGGGATGAVTLSIGNDNIVPSMIDLFSEHFDASTTSLILKLATNGGIESTGAGLGINVDGTTIQLNGSGELEVVSASVSPDALAQQGASSGQVLKWSGTAWVPSTDLSGGGGGSGGDTASDSDVILNADNDSNGSGDVILQTRNLDRFKVTSIGHVETGSQTQFTIKRAAPTVVGDAIELGSFFFDIGQGFFEIVITGGAGGVSYSKVYQVPVDYDGPITTWYELIPQLSSNPYNGNDVTIDVYKPDYRTYQFRLRRTSGVAPHTATISYRAIGSINAATWTDNSATSSPGAPSEYFVGNSLFSEGGRTGVNTVNPVATLDVNGEIRVGSTTALACAAGTAGTLRYNSTSNKVEFCDGTSFAELGAGAGSGSVTAADIQDNTITTIKIADGAITLDKISTASGNSGLQAVQASTGERDWLTASATAGMMVFNTDTAEMEVYTGSAWVPIGADSVGLDDAYDGAGAGTGRSVTVDAGAVEFNGAQALNEVVNINNSQNGGVLRLTNTGTGSTLYIEDEANDETPFVITANGNVGIGTDNPSSQLLTLDSGAGNYAGTYYTGNNNQSAGVVVIEGGTGTFYYDAYASYGGHHFRIGGNSVLRMYNDQSISVGSATNESSAILNLESFNRGFLPPRMTTASKTAITNATNGLIVYDTDLDQLSVYNGTAWTTAGSSSLQGAWAEGNVVDLSSGNPVVLNASTSREAALTTDGFVGIGTASPEAALHVAIDNDVNPVVRVQTNNTYFDIYGDAGSGAVFDHASQSFVFKDDVILDGLTSTDLLLQNGARILGNSSHIQLVPNNAASSVIMQGAAGQTADYLQIRSNGATNGDIYTVNSAGNVGIGSTVPNNKLDVVGTTSMTGDLIVGSSGGGCASVNVGAIRNNGTNLEYCDGTSWSAFAGAGTGTGSLQAAYEDGYEIRPGANPVTIVRETNYGVPALAIRSTDSTATPYQLSFYNDTATGSPTWNLGIGTAALGYNGSFGIWKDGTYKMILDNNNNIGGIQGIGARYLQDFDFTLSNDTTGAGQGMFDIGYSGGFGGMKWTSGEGIMLRVGTGQTNSGLFNPASGNAHFTLMQLGGVISQSGTATGSYTGLKINMVETNLQNNDARLIDAKRDNVTRFSVDREGHVAIGTQAKDNSAALEIDSGYKGFLPPRMSTASMNAILSPAVGLVVYNTDTDELRVYNGTGWNVASASGTVDTVLGEWDTSSYTYNTNYQATTDAIVTAWVDVDSNDRCQITGHTDSTATPSTMVAFAYAQEESGPAQRIRANSITFPVRAGDYWRVGLGAEAGTCAGDDGQVRYIPILRTANASSSGGTITGSISDGDIEDDAITTNTIVDGAVTIEKLSTASGSAGLTITNATTGARDGMTAVAGMTVFNTETNQLEIYNGTAWESVGSGGSGTASLDSAYDDGRVITADAGAVTIHKSAGGEDYLSFTSDSDGGSSRLDLGMDPLSVPLSSPAGLITSNADLLFINDTDGNQVNTNTVFGYNGNSDAYTESMRIMDDKVGIGTTTPNNRLDVVGTVSMTGDLIVGTSGGGCASVNIGTIRLNGSDLEFCDGTAWTIFAGNVTTASLDSAYDEGRVITADNGAVEINGANGGLLVEETGNAVPFRVNDSAGDSSPFIIDQDGRVAIGNASPTSLAKLYLYTTSSNITDYGTTYGYASHSATVNGTYYQIGERRQNLSYVATGVTNSGYSIGDSVSVLRGNNGGDGGTLTSLYGAYTSYGHGNLGASSALTTNGFGLYVAPYAQTGSITTAHDIYVAAGASATDNIGTHYGLNIQGSHKQNYMAGTLNVAGDSLIGGKMQYVDWYNVSDTVNPTFLSYNGGALSTNYIYKVSLTTAATGTDTGASFILWYDEANTTWAVRTIAMAGMSSNHPELFVDAGVPKLRVFHTTVYPVVANVEAKYVYEPDALYHVFGADAQWQRLGQELAYQDGEVVIGASMTQVGSAVLELHSTTKGFLPPRMTGGERDSIGSASNGLIIYNTDTEKLNFYNGTVWEDVGAGTTATASLDSVYDGGTTIVADSGAVTIQGSGAGGSLLVEDSGTGIPFRVNDEASDSSPFVIDTNGAVGIGTDTPISGVKLDIDGKQVTDEGNGVMVFENLATFRLQSNNNIGTMKIALPVTWNNTMMHIEIEGYNYDVGTGAWRVVVGGYNFAPSPAWFNESVHIEGNPPFDTVRLGHDGTYNVILLGDMTTDFDYPIISVSKVVARGASMDDLGGAWSISQLANETGLTNIKTPIRTDGIRYVASTTNYQLAPGKFLGIGTSTPTNALTIQHDWGMKIFNSNGGDRHSVLNSTGLEYHADSGGWAIGTQFHGPSGLKLGEFGANGGGDSLTYLYIGRDYDEPMMRVYDDRVAIASGTTGTPDADALLDLQATDKGFLPPRLTTTQRDAISTPPAGLQVYNSTENEMQWYNGTDWVTAGTAEASTTPAKFTHLTRADYAAGGYTAATYFNPDFTETASDTLGAADLTNDRINIPEAGHYLIQAQAFFCAQTSHYSNIQILVNGTSMTQVGSQGSGCYAVTAVWAQDLDSGDQVEMELYDSVNGPTQGIRNIDFFVTQINTNAGGGGSGSGIATYTQVQINALSPSEGTTVYNSDEDRLEVYNGTDWATVGTGTGNSSSTILSDEGTGYSYNTVYQADSDLIVQAWLSATSSGQLWVYGQAGDTNPPTVNRVQDLSAHSGAANTSMAAITYVVKKGEYWRVNVSGPSFSYSIRTMKLEADVGRGGPADNVFSEAKSGGFTLGTTYTASTSGMVFFSGYRGSSSSGVWGYINGVQTQRAWSWWDGSNHVSIATLSFPVAKGDTFRVQYETAGSEVVNSYFFQPILAGDGSVGSLTASNGDEIVYVDTYGNVGIGTTTPAAKLDVAGEILEDGRNVMSGLQVITCNSSGGGNCSYSGGIAYIDCNAGQVIIGGGCRCLNETVADYEILRGSYRYDTNTWACHCGDSGQGANNVSMQAICVDSD